MRVFWLTVLIPACAVCDLICMRDTAIALAASFLSYLSAALLEMHASICILQLPPNSPRALLKLNLLTGWTLFCLLKVYRLACGELRQYDGNEIKQKI